MDHRLNWAMVKRGDGESRVEVNVFARNEGIEYYY